MPQNPVLIYSTEDGTPTYMHTVDAAEAVRLGDYTPTAPGEPSPEAKASAMSRFKTGQATTHPEMQTPEEKAASREKANEDAALLAGLPPGTPIVVQAPSERPASQAARQAAQRQREHPHGGPPGQTGEHPQGGPPGQTPPTPTPTAPASQTPPSTRGSGR